jgi:hypothetical protein
MDPVRLFGGMLGALLLVILPAGFALLAWDSRARNRWRSAEEFARIGLVAGFAVYAGAFAVGAIHEKGPGLLALPLTAGRAGVLVLLALGGGATVLCWWILQDARREVVPRRGP